MRAFVVAAAALLGVLSVATRPVGAVDLHKARLTSIELSKCRVLKKHRDGGAWLCQGLRGYPVYFAEGDLREMMAFGPSPQRRRSATQTLTPFNSIFQDKRGRPTIEWRVESDGRGRIVPFATIVRYHTSLDGETGDVLVITKVDTKDSCHLAVIDARANPEAMATARTWAIAEAKKRSCPQTPEVLGAKGKVPM